MTLTQPLAHGASGAASLAPVLIASPLLVFFLAFGAPQPLLIVAVALLLLTLPSWLLPAITVLAFKGAGMSALTAPVAGPLYVSDVLMIVFLARSLTRLRGDRNSTFWLPALGTLFAFWTISVSAFHGVSLTPILRLLLYMAVGVTVVRTPKTANGFRWAVLVYAFLEFAAAIPTLPARLIGPTLGDPAQFGGLMLVALLLSAMTLKGRLRPLAIAYFMAGVALSQTRAVWFAALACLAVYLVRSRGRFAPFVVPLTGTAVGIPLLPWINETFNLNPASAQYRMASLSQGLEDIKARPFSGGGWAFKSDVQLSPFSEVASPYNLWIYVATCTGLIGALIFLAWLVSLAARLGKERSVGLYAFVALIAIGVSEMPIYAGSFLSYILMVALSPPHGWDWRDFSATPAHPVNSPQSHLSTPSAHSIR